MRAYCPFCKKLVVVEPNPKKITIKFKGEKYTTYTMFYKCSECGYKYIRESDQDSVLAVYRKYRIRHNIPQPEEIIEIQKLLGLSDNEFANKLGLTIGELNKYKQGELIIPEKNILEIIDKLKSEKEKEQEETTSSNAL